MTYLIITILASVKHAARELQVMIIGGHLHTWHLLVIHLYKWHLLVIHVHIHHVVYISSNDSLCQ